MLTSTYRRFAPEDNHESLKTMQIMNNGTCSRFRSGVLISRAALVCLVVVVAGCGGSPTPKPAAAIQPPSVTPAEFKNRVLEYLDHIKDSVKSVTDEDDRERIAETSTRLATEYRKLLPVPKDIKDGDIMTELLSRIAHNVSAACEEADNNLTESRLGNKPAVDAAKILIDVYFSTIESQAELLRKELSSIP